MLLKSRFLEVEIKEGEKIFPLLRAMGVVDPKQGARPWVGYSVGSMYENREVILDDVSSEGDALSTTHSTTQSTAPLTTQSTCSSVLTLGEVDTEDCSSVPSVVGSSQQGVGFALSSPLTPQAYCTDTGESSDVPTADDSPVASPVGSCVYFEEEKDHPPPSPVPERQVARGASRTLRRSVRIATSPPSRGEESSSLPAQRAGVGRRGRRRGGRRRVV